MNLLEINIDRKNDKGWPITALRYQTGDLLPIRSEGLFKIDLATLNSLIYLPEEYGEMLGQAVFQGEIESAFGQALTDAKGMNTPLRVLLYVEADNLRDLHWERLCAQTDGAWDFLSLNQSTPYSLYLPSLIDRRFPPLNRRHLNAIILIAGPEELEGDYSLPSFDIQSAAKIVSSSLGKIPHHILANLDGATGQPNLTTLCKQIASNRYSLLHIVCHGAYEPDSKETILFFPDENGRPVTTSKLIERLKNLSPLPHLTFLSSCESAVPNAETGLGGTAQRLVRELGMPAVLAMAEKVSIRTAQKITSIFYTRLYEHGEVDLAVADALASIQEEEDVTTPVLFGRLGNRPLFCDTTTYIPNQPEIRFGLDRLKEEVAVRAPVLTSDVQALDNLFPTDVKLDEKTVYSIITKANELCGEIFDNTSFVQVATGEKIPPYDSRCPFPGIGPFTKEDKDFFLGRENIVSSILEKIDRDSFLAILGSSGSGKSSIILAGLLPRLEAAPIYLVPGRDPIKALEKSLSEAASPESIIIIDQFEELFTAPIDQAKKSLFIERLLAQNSVHKIIIAMRSDFLGECEQFEALKSKIETSLLLISPLGAQVLPQIAQRQADMVKLRFDEGLFGKIVEDVIEEPAAMSLLQHALWCLWERRRGRWLRFSEYHAFGGIKKAIAHTADQFYEGLYNTEKELVREIFLRLVRPDESLAGEHKDTRRRIPLEEVVPSGARYLEVIETIRILANMRLVVTSTIEQTGEEQVELAHEALIQHWPKLKHWLSEDRENLRLRETIRTAAMDWEQGHQEDSLLVHRGGRLDDAVALTKQSNFALNALELKYVNACLDLRDREKRAVDRRRKRVIAGLAFALLITIGLTIFAFTQRAEMQVQKQHALDRLLLTQTQLLDIRESKNAIPRLGLSIEAFDRLHSVDAYLGLWSSMYLFKPEVLYIETGDAVKDICFFPNSKTLVSINLNSIQVWDTKTGALLRQINIASSNLQDNQIEKILCRMDGESVISSFDERVSIWDTSTGANILEFSPGAIVADFAISPDEKHIVAGDKGGQLWLLESNSDQPITVSMTGSPVRNVIFSPDGAQIVSTHDDGLVRVWDFTTGENVSLTDETDAVLLAYSPDSQWLAAGGKDGMIFVWDAPGMESYRIISHREEITALTFSPDGKLLLSSSRDNTSKVWRVPEFLDVSIMNTYGHINSASFNLQFPYLVMGGFSGYAHVLEQGEIDQTGKLPYYGLISLPLEGQINKAIFNQSGSLFAAASEYGDIAISPIKTYYLYHDSQVRQIEFNPSNDTLITSSWDGTAKTWDAQTGSRVFTLKHSDKVNYATFSPDGLYAATASSDDTAKVWNVADGQEVFTIPHESDVIDVKFSPDGKLVASADNNGTAQIWRIQDKSKVFEVHHQQAINRILFSPNNQWVITASDDRTIAISDLAQHTGILTLTLDSPVTDIGITPASDLIAAGEESGRVTVWKIIDGKQVFAETLDDTPIRKIAINPGGTLLAAGNNSGKIGVWQLPDGKQVGRFEADKAVWDLIFSGSDFLIAASSDTLVHIYDLISKSEYGRITNEGLVMALDLSADGHLLAYSTTAGISKFVLWRREDIVSEACSRIPRQLSESEWYKYFEAEEQYNPFCVDYLAGK